MWFLGLVSGREHNIVIVICMSNALNYGWSGHSDTWETMESSFGGLVDMWVILKGKKGAAE